MTIKRSQLRFDAFPGNVTQSHSFTHLNTPSRPTAQRETINTHSGRRGDITQWQQSSIPIITARMTTMTP
jgi:hypothetical protein